MPADISQPLAVTIMQPHVDAPMPSCEQASWSAPARESTVWQLATCHSIPLLGLSKYVHNMLSSPEQIAMPCCCRLP